MNLLLGTHLREDGKAVSVEVAVDAKGRLKNSSLEIEIQEIPVAQAGLTTLATVVVSGYARGFFQFLVSGQALDQFVIMGRATKNAPWSSLYSTTDDYEVPRGIMIGISGDLSNLAPGTNGDITLDLRGFYELRFAASSAHISGSTVSTFGGAA